MDENILQKIKDKRELSEIPDIDIKTAYSHFEKRQVDESEKIKLTREFLRKLFSAFISKKLLSLKDKDSDWILRKHISTRERLPYYDEIYRRIFADSKKINVFDLGAGINGFSYNFFNKLGLNVDYTAIESVGQLVTLMNHFFQGENLSGQAVHLSLLNEEKVKQIISKPKDKKIIFMFKVIDALESLKPNYSKELISSLIPLVDKMVISFATHSLGNRKKFKANRNWILNFIEDNFHILDDFELGGERYISFSRRKINK